ncbi:MAG: nucleotidyltransferase domain-containing protein [Nanoarchaeota archaeon]
MDDKKHSTLGSHMTPGGDYVPSSQLPATQTASADMGKHYESLKKTIVKKFPFVVSLSVIPPQMQKLFEEDEGLTKEEIERKPVHLFMVIPEEEYANIPKKIKPELLKIIHESKENVWVHIKTPVDVWNYGLDSKFDMVDAVAASYPLHDKGLLGALRVANIHKTLVLRKFEKYVASYVVGGSLVRGTADADSDVDTFVIIDDTDVKKMPRLQLKEKLRGFIQDYIREANAYAGVKNILNVQVYLLTEFWESVKDANPVIFTFIRDGVPMYDRGTFLPWKLLLKMGKIKPSPEAVDMFMKYGDQNESLVKRRMIDGMIDIYWGVVTPTQALMMLAGEAPPAPKTLVADVKRLFVDKEKIMAMRELKILEKVVKYYKDHEHGKLESMKGAELDILLKEAGEYDKKLKELRKKLEKRIVEHTAERIYGEVFGILKNMFGNKSDNILISSFERELVKSGKTSARFMPILKALAKLPQKIKKSAVTHNEIELVRREATELLTAMIEFNQRKELASFSGTIMKIEGEREKAELVSTIDGIFLLAHKDVMHFNDKSFTPSTREKFEVAMEKTKQPVKLIISSALTHALQQRFGKYNLSF